LLTALAGETLEHFRDDIIEIVEQCRYDKVSKYLSIVTSHPVCLG